jgi:signal transduction histidine kinase
MFRIFRSTAVRLALAYAGIFVLSSLTLVGFLWWRTASYLDSEVDAVIRADTQAIGDRLHDFGLPGAIQSIKERVGRAGDDHAIYLLTDPTLTPIAGNLDGWPVAIGHRQGWQQIQLAYQGTLHATRFLYVVLPDGFQLLIGRDVQDRVAIRRTILNGLGWSTAIAILLAVAGGLLVRRGMLRRVDAITLTTTAIIQGDLTSRLPAGDSSDEFDRLAHTINTMLHQIEILIDGVRSASNAVAHDLRTPLAELRGRLETLIRAQPSPERTFQEVEGAVTDLDRVIAVFNALLRLAEIDSGARLSGFRQVSLQEIAAEVIELYGAVAEEKGIILSLDVAADLVVFGDPFLLAQAIGNLVDNAVKYCSPSSLVAIRAARLEEGSIDISVSDNGPGIPDHEKPRVTERFYRGTAGGLSTGVGLGLSLVSAVARLHGGSFVLTDAYPGLVATMVLPRSARPVLNDLA